MLSGSHLRFEICRPGDASASNLTKPQFRIQLPSRRKLNQNTEVQRGWKQMRHRVDKFQSEMRTTKHERAEKSVCTHVRVGYIKLQKAPKNGV